MRQLLARAGRLQILPSEYLEVGGGGQTVEPRITSGASVDVGYTIANKPLLAKPC
jgi:hypothetical protein